MSLFCAGLTTALACVLSNLLAFASATTLSFFYFSLNGEALTIVNSVYILFSLNLGGGFYF